MARYIHKKDGSGQLAGSIGDGRDQVPTTAAAGAAVPVTDREPLPSLTGVADQFRQGTRARRHQLTAALAYAGLTERQREDLLAYVDRQLAADGTFEHHTDPAMPTPPGAAVALAHGNTEVYEALCAGLDERDRQRAITAAVTPVEQVYPQAAHHVRAFFESVAVTRTRAADLGLLDPVAAAGPLTYQAHPFANRVGDDYRIRPGVPTTVADVRDLLERCRTDGTIRSFDDLVTATYLRGPLALTSGAWRIDHAQVSADILAASFEMEEDAVYQALALVYSQGRSMDSGYDAAWTPGAGLSATDVPRGVREWLRGYGRNTKGFGAWAARPIIMSPAPKRQTPVVDFGYDRTAGDD